MKSIKLIKNRCSMKTLRNYLFVIVMLLVFSQCKKNNNDDDDNNVSVDPRDSFIGNYWVTDSLFFEGNFTGTDPYALQVSKGNTIKDTLYFGNFLNSGGSAYALLAGNNFSIPWQEIVTSVHTNGSGKFENNTISYETSEGSNSQKGYGTKQ
jgi:hypothetical protein